MNNLVNYSGHLSDHDLAALKEGKLHENNILALSEHMSHCSLCAGRYADSFAEDGLLEVPAGFRENIISRLKSEKEDRKQMIFYSIRVAVAACATLVFIFSGALNYIACLDEKIREFGTKGQYVANVVNTSFQNFSNKILNMEGFENENENEKK